MQVQNLPRQLIGRATWVCKPSSRQRLRRPPPTATKLAGADNLLHRDGRAPDSVGSSDVAYIATDESCIYLAVVIDLFSRQVVGTRERESL